MKKSDPVLRKEAGFCSYRNLVIKGVEILSSFVEKLLKGTAGSVVTVEPDYVIVNDGVSNASVDDVSSVRYPERVLVIYDHDVPTGRPEAAAILKKNLNFADKYHCKYIQAKGIGYQYLANEVIQEGQIVIGGGSHAGIFGAKGALGIDVSIPELSRIIETGRYSTVVPETVYVNLKGQLSQGVNAMDVAFTLLREHREVLVKKAIEIYAPMFSGHEREIFSGTVCIGGAYTSGFCVTESANAINIDLSQVVPMVMMPCQARKDQKNADIISKAEIANTELNAGQLGGFTGGTIEDLRLAAKIIEGKKLALGFRLSVCPATSRDYIMACEEGIITKFIDYGAQINAAGDHSEVVQGPGAMGYNEKLLTTGFYTYTGAMGVDSSLVYSASVEAVAQASYTKRI